MNLRAVDCKREKSPARFEARPCLRRFVIRNHQKRRQNSPRLIDHNLSDKLSMNDRRPLHREFQPFGGEERHGHIPGPFKQPEIEME